MSAVLQNYVERYTTIAGRRVRLRVHGEGQPILLINGLGGNVATWAPLLGQLKGFEVITFDAPGVGRSQSPRRPYTVDLIADVAGQVAEAADHERVDVLGYSFGGAVAQRLALKRPELVRRLVLANTSCGAGAIPGALRALLAVSTPVRHYSKSGLSRSHESDRPRPRGKGEHLGRGADRCVHREAAPSPLGYALQMTAFSTFHSLPWLHRVEQPTLVLAGTDDHLVPMANSAVLAAYLPDARLRVFERWGHYLLHDPSSGAGASVADFLGAQDHSRTLAWRGGLTVSAEEMREFVNVAPRSAHPSSVTGGLVRRLYPISERSRLMLAREDSPLWRRAFDGVERRVSPRIAAATSSPDFQVATQLLRRAARVVTAPVQRPHRQGTARGGSAHARRHASAHTPVG